MLAYDSNIFYNAIKDCRFASNREKCKTMKKQALLSLQLGRIDGCVILPTVEREVRRAWIEEYAYFCKVRSVKPKEQKFIDQFVSKLTTIAMKDEEFLRACTSEAPSKEERIAKAMRGDWRIVAESMLVNDNPVRLVSFDRNIISDYCKTIYKQVAKEVAEKEGIKISDDWDAVKPSKLLEEVVKDEANRIRIS